MKQIGSKLFKDCFDFLNYEEHYSAVKPLRKIKTHVTKIEDNLLLTMGWTTLYIGGNADFRDEVRDRLDDSNLDLMPGYTGGATSFDFHDLYWVDEKTSLRRIKEAIGSKLIWKYRLRFYPTLEEFIEAQNRKSKNTSFTEEDLALIAEMQMR